jgi:4-hydroxy-tetrahydrodipicolinate reductase
MVPRILAATPGLKRVIDLPAPSALMGPSAYDRRT